jgi:hypothetical protein
MDAQSIGITPFPELICRSKNLRAPTFLLNYLPPVEKPPEYKRIKIGCQ